jgi:hypothetical protein
MLEEAYGEAEMKKTQVYDWHKRFRDGYGPGGFICTEVHLHISRWWSKSALPSTV